MHFPVSQQHQPPYLLYCTYCKCIGIARLKVSWLSVTTHVSHQILRNHIKHIARSIIDFIVIASLNMCRSNAAEYFCFNFFPESLLNLAWKSTLSCKSITFHFHPIFLYPDFVSCIRNYLFFPLQISFMLLVSQTSNLCAESIQRSILR